VYDVDRLVSNDSGKLATLVQVLTGSLNVTKSSALVGIQPFNGKLVVTATPDLQEQVVSLLKMLGEAAPATRPATAAAKINFNVAE
jgi:hypothetical protein